MTPRRDTSSDDERFRELETQLRAGADLVRRDPSPELRTRVMSRVRERAHEPRRPYGVWVPRLAAAAVLLLFGVWIGQQLREGPRTGVTVAGADVVKPLRELLRLPQPGELDPDQPLLAEAQNLWNDTSRAALGLVRRLPGPLRLDVPPEEEAESQ